MSIQYSCWAHAVIEISVLVASAFNQKYPNFKHEIKAYHILLHSVRFGDSPSPSISYPPLRIFAALLALAVNWARYLCYRELGRYFTFQIAIFGDHKLVTTGPYAIVRHPSYTMAFLMFIANFLSHASPGAWLWESRFYEMKLSWFFLVPSVLTFFLFMFIMITRPGKEDELLKKEFGKKWEEWAEAVPYRLIPGVY